MSSSGAGEALKEVSSPEATSSVGAGAALGQVSSPPDRAPLEQVSSPDETSYKALGPGKRFPGVVVKIVMGRLWWGLAIPWRAMGSKGSYKLCGILHRQSEMLNSLFHWVHGHAPQGHHFALHRDLPENKSEFGVSCFASTAMLIPFFVWASCASPMAGRNKHRNRKSYQLSLEVWVDFINTFCSRVPHRWSVDLGERGGVAPVVRGIVDLSNFWAAAVQSQELRSFCEAWQVLALTRSCQWCTSSPPHVPLGEFIGVCLVNWKLNTEIIWDFLLPQFLRKLCKVMHHYAPWIASEDDLVCLPQCQVQKRDSILLCQWLREMLASHTRRDLPECLAMQLILNCQPAHSIAKSTHVIVAAKRTQQCCHLLGCAKGGNMSKL